MNSINVILAQNTQTGYSKNAPFAAKGKHILEVVNLCSLLPKWHFRGNYNIFLLSFGKQKEWFPECPARTEKSLLSESGQRARDFHFPLSFRSGVLRKQ